MDMGWRICWLFCLKQGEFVYGNPIIYNNMTTNGKTPDFLAYFVDKDLNIHHDSRAPHRMYCFLFRIKQFSLPCLKLIAPHCIVASFVSEIDKRRAKRTRFGGVDGFEIRTTFATVSPLFYLQHQLLWACAHKTLLQTRDLLPLISGVSDLAGFSYGRLSGLTSGWHWQAPGYSYDPS